MIYENKHEREYKLITDHIFFGDNALLKRNQFFIGINLALFTMVGFFIREIYVNNSTSKIPILFKQLLILLPIIGSFISLFWAKMIGKIEAHLNLRVRRAKFIEKKVGYYIYESNAKYNYRWYQNPSSWTIFMFFAYLFSLVWFIVFVIATKELFYLKESWDYPILWSALLLGYYLITDIILTEISNSRFVK